MSYVLIIPMIIALSINLLFLVNIVRIIVTKLRNQPSSSLSSQQLQVTSNLSLLPLFLNLLIWHPVGPDHNTDS